MSKNTTQHAMPAVLVGAVLAICALGVYLLIPSSRQMLERQIEDGRYREVLDYVTALPVAEKSKDPRFYDLAEMTARLQLESTPTEESQEKLLDAILERGREHGFDPAFQRLVVRGMSRLTNELITVRVMKHYFEFMPDSFRRAIGERLVGQALANNQPAAAAEIWKQLVENEPSDENGLELIRLYRASGNTKPVLSVLNRWAEQFPDFVSRFPRCAAKRVDLLRENGEQQLALKAYRQLLLQGPRAPSRDDILYFCQLAREAGQPGEAVPFLVEAARHPDPPVEILENLAESALAAGNLGQAIEALEELRKRVPTDGRILLRLGRLLEWNRRPGEAIDRYLEAANQKTFADLDRLFLLANQLNRKKDLHPFLPEIEQEIRLQQFEIPVARLCADLGDYTGANFWYEQYLKREQSPDVSILVEIATMLIDQNALDKASALLHDAQAKHPGNTRLIAARAEVFFRKGQDPQALAQYEELLKLRLETSWLRSALILARSMGHMETMHGLFQQILKDSDRAEPYHYQLLADALSAEGLHTQAMELLVSATVRFPGSFPLAHQAADALADQEKTAEALAMLERHPDFLQYPEALQLALRCQIKLRRWKEAEQLLAKRAKNSTAEPRILLEYQALVAEGLGRRSEAVDLYCQLQDQYPDYMHYRVKAVNLLAQSGRINQARKLLGEPGLDEPEMLELAARVYASAEMFRLAEKYQRLYIQAGPRDEARAWGFLGDICHSRGNKQAATLAYRKSLAVLSGNIVRKGNPR